MQITAKAICDLLGGTLEGNPDVLISGPSKIEEGQAGTISFLANPKYEEYAYSTKASALLVSRDWKPESPISATLIRVDNVYEAIGLLINQYAGQNESEQGVSDLAMVSPEATVAPDAYIGPFSVVEKGAVIEAGARLNGQVGSLDELHSPPPSSALPLLRDRVRGLGRGHQKHTTH